MALDRTWYNTLVDDDGSNTVGSIWDKADVDALMDATDAEIVRLDAGIAAAGSTVGTSSPTTTGTQTALALPTGNGNLVIYANNATLLTVQGIAAGLSGQRLTIISKGAGQVDFAHAHASGTALGKLALFATTGLTSLAAGSGVAEFQYDLPLTKWRLISHDQGAWITPAFNAADYTASSGTWTVEAGDMQFCRYRLSGRTLAFQFFFYLTSVSATPATLNRVIPGGFTAATRITTAGDVLRSDNGGTLSLAGLNVGAGGSSIEFYLAPTQVGNWATAVNTNQVKGAIHDIEVQ